MAKVEVDPDFLKDVADATEVALDAQAAVVITKAKENISRPGRPTSKSGMKDFKRGLKQSSDALRAGRTDLTGSRAGLGRQRLAGSLIASARRGVKVLADKTIEFANKSFTDPPGGFPRRRTGRLRRSLTWDAPEKGRRSLGSDMPPKTGYAAIHEFGGSINHPGGTPYRFIAGRLVFLRKVGSGDYTSLTKPHKIKMPARPYLRPALNTTTKQQADAFAKAFDAYMESKGRGKGK